MITVLMLTVEEEKFLCKEKSKQWMETKQQHMHHMHLLM